MLYLHKSLYFLALPWHFEVTDEKLSLADLQVSQDTVRIVQIAYYIDNGRFDVTFLKDI